MRDFCFGENLCKLRQNVGLSQSELGKAVGVTNRAVSKWETGESKPAVKQLKKVADVLEVTVDKLLDCAENNKEIKKIVITGGPCAGKSTALSWIYNEYTKKGYSVVIIPECATELILAGISSKSLNSQLEFQKALLEDQLFKEKLFLEASKNFSADKVLIVCDRGALDGKAYMTNAEFKKLLRVAGKTEVELRDNYDAVFHLVSVAKDAPQFYSLENNKARSESVEEAKIADDKTISAWAGHPHLRVIDNSTDFENKMRRLLKELSLFLGEPEPYEIERKYLIKMPNIEKIKNPTLKKLEIIQTYLNSRDGEEVRIRQRGDGNSFIYTKTVKKKVTDTTRAEYEKRISREEYLSLLLEADTTRSQIRKTRYCLVHKNQYLEVDIYPNWKDKAILEVELTDEKATPQIPKYFEIIEEVTGDLKFSNFQLAKKDV